MTLYQKFEIVAASRLTSFGDEPFFFIMRLTGPVLHRISSPGSEESHAYPTA